MLNRMGCNPIRFTNLLIINNIQNNRLHDYRITPLFLNTHFLNCIFIRIYILLYIYLYTYISIKIVVRLRGWLKL